MQQSKRFLISVICHINEKITLPMHDKYHAISHPTKKKNFYTMQLLFLGLSRLEGHLMLTQTFTNWSSHTLSKTMEKGIIKTSNTGLS